MKAFTKIAAAGVFAVSAVLTANSAAALPFDLSGTFQITAYNYNLVGDNTQRSNGSQATATNFNALANNTAAFASGIMSGTFTYTGALDFRQANNVNLTTVSSWLGTGTGVVDDLDGTFGGKTLSAGEGGGDSGGGGSFVTATLFKITATSLNIGDLGNLWDVNHDDGVTFLGSGGSSVASIGPNTVKTTNLFKKLSGGVSDFTLYYAAANGNPSILEVQAIPLPAAAWLLLGVSGALVAAKRRRSRNA